MSPYPFIKTKIHIKPIQKIIFLHKKRMKEKKGSYRVSEERNALSRMEISWQIWSVSPRTATATAELQLLEGSRPHRSICMFASTKIRKSNTSEPNRKEALTRSIYWRNDERSMQIDAHKANSQDLYSHRQGPQEASENEAISCKLRDKRPIYRYLNEP